MTLAVLLAAELMGCRGLRRTGAGLLRQRRPTSSAAFQRFSSRC